MERPNIFDYATKELSQDAMVCWLFACLKSDDENYKKIGKNFVKFILKEEIKGEDIDNIKIEIEDKSPVKQRYSADVFALVRVEDKLYPILFEDKTDTYLHDDQFKKSCENLIKDMKQTNLDLHSSGTTGLTTRKYQWGKLVYVYYKIGYEYGWQGTDFNEQKGKAHEKVKEKKKELFVNKILIEDMIEFLKANQINNEMLIKNYLTFLESKNEKDDKSKNEWINLNVWLPKNNIDEEYSLATLMIVLFENIFGKEAKFVYNYQKWIEYSFLRFKDENQDQSKDILYGFRFKLYDNKFSFILLQNRNDKKLGTDQLEEKKKNYEMISEICEGICEEMKNERFNISKGDIKTESQNAINQKPVIVIPISKNNSPENVCVFIKEFTKRFCKECENRFPGKIELDESIKTMIELN